MTVTISSGAINAPNHFLKSLRKSDSARFGGGTSRSLLAHPDYTPSFIVAA